MMREEKITLRPHFHWETYPSLLNIISSESFPWNQIVAFFFKVMVRMLLRGLVFCLQTRKIFKPWLLYKLQGKISSTWFDDLLTGIARGVHRWTCPNGFCLKLWFLWILMGPSKIFWYFGEFLEYNVKPSEIVPSSPCFFILHVWSLVWILMGDLRISETSTSLQWSKKKWCQHQLPNPPLVRKWRWYDDLKN